MVKISRQSLTKWSSIVAVMAVVLSPVAASAASNAANTTITANVAPMITMTTSGTVTLNVTPDGDGQASSASDTVTVSTNEQGGYDLVLEDSDADTDLDQGATASITAHTGTNAAPTTLANNSWGYRVVNNGGFGATATAAQTNVDALTGTWAGVLSSAGAGDNIKSTTTTATNDTTTVWYGVKADSTKPDGAYTNTVTYTATTK